MAGTKKGKPRHLGRGLQSLLSPIISGKGDVQPISAATSESVKFPIDKELRESMKHIEIDEISMNPYQPRVTWNDKDLADLAESIKANGVIQPILVRPADGGYQIIAGERRFRAAKLASLNTIPAIVRQASDEQLLELALIENIHRTDLNPIERAKAYQKYIDTFSFTQAQTAAKLGEDRSVIANYLRLLDLPGEIKKMLSDGRLTMGHARAILGLPTDDLRCKLANRALAGRLSVREVEKFVRRYIGLKEDKTSGKTHKSPHIMDLERQMRKELGTKVSIETRKNGQRGKIVIEFYSLDEFDRIAEKIGITDVERA